MFIFPYTGVPQKLEVRVRNRGNALLSIKASSNKTFTLKPTITWLTPRIGSLIGNTLLKIQGEGFSSSRDKVRVRIGSISCSVVSVNTTCILCRTNSQLTPGSYDMLLTANNIESICRSDVGCTFVYSAGSTPRVDYVTPTSFCGTTNHLRFYGSRFASNPKSAAVEVENNSYLVTSSSIYQIDCTVGATAAGKTTASKIASSSYFSFFGCKIVAPTSKINCILKII